MQMNTIKKYISIFSKRFAKSIIGMNVAFMLCVIALFCLSEIMPISPLEWHDLVFLYLYFLVVMALSSAVFAYKEIKGKNDEGTCNPKNKASNFFFREWVALPYAAICSAIIVIISALLLIGDRWVSNTWAMEIILFWGGIPLLVFSLIVLRLQGKALIFACAASIVAAVLPMIVFCASSDISGMDLAASHNVFLLVLPNLLSVVFILIETEIVKRGSDQS